MITKHIFVRIPIAARKSVIATGPDLDEPNPSFEQPSGNQAFPAENVSLFGDIDFLGKFSQTMIEPIQFEDMPGFAGDVERFRGR